MCRGLAIPGASKSTTSWQGQSKCVAKLGKIPLFVVKVRIKKKRPGTDFVSIPGSFMIAEAGLEFSMAFVFYSKSYKYNVKHHSFPNFSMPFYTIIHHPLAPP